MSVPSPDDKLSENIWFVWSKTSYDGDKWRCYHGDKRTTISENRASQQIDQGLLTFAILNEEILTVDLFQKQDADMTSSLFTQRQKEVKTNIILRFFATKLVRFLLQWRVRIFNRLNLIFI